MKNVLLAIILTIAATSFAQTISPLTNECGKKCSGQFSVTNNNVIPLTVTIEPYALLLVDGKPSMGTLAGVAEVRLNAMSARLSPKQMYTFDYHIHCIQYPCTVGVAAGMTVGHTDNGVLMRLVLNHVIYACEKAKNCRVTTLKAAGIEVAKN